MAFALKLMMILFMVNAMLYLGLPDQRLIPDASTSVMGSVFDTNTLNTSNPQLNNALINTIPANQTFTQAGASFGLLFTPIIFIFSFISFLINLFLAPMAIMSFPGMPVIFKILIGGGLQLSEVLLMLSLLTGRDI